jgi:hypothetical protein
VEILHLYTGATEEYNGSTWTSVNSMNTARLLLAGCGIQTAALAFGGIDHTCYYRSNRRIRWNKLGNKSRKFKHSKRLFSRCWYTNGSFSFWWWIHLLQQQQKNGMEQVLQQQLQSQLLNPLLIYLINVERVKK